MRLLWATFLFLLLLPYSSPQFAQAAESYSLKDAFLSAVMRSDNIGVQKELLVQASELKTQASGALFPTLGGSVSLLKQSPTLDSEGVVVSRSNQNTVKLSLSQPLFRGFRDFAALRQKGDQVEAQNFTLQNAAKQLFYDLATAFYNVLLQKGDEKNYLNEIEVNQKRLKELQAFYRIGRSQLSDVLTLKSNISSLEAQLESTRTQLETAKDVLAYMTGWNRDSALQDLETIPGESSPVTAYLSLMDRRPDIRLAVANVQSFEEGVPIARGAHFPSADIFGDYYLVAPQNVKTPDWDIQFLLTIPIFQGGVIQSQVRQALSAVRQYNHLLSDARKTAEEEIRTFYDAFVGDQRQMNKLTETVVITRETYEVEVRDYRNGLLTNLDVLQAITTFQDSQRLLDRQRTLVKLDAAKLQAATAQRPEVDLHLEVKK